MKVRHLFFFLLACSFSMTAQAQIQSDPGQTTGDTGTVTFTYRGSQVTYTTVRTADGNIWLQQNLGAARVATASDDTNAFGHYFQWGRWDDGHQIRTSDTARAAILSPNNPSGIAAGSDKFYYWDRINDWWWAAITSAATWTAATPSATNGTDPCAALGKHWRLATSQEWEGLMTLENITNTATAFASNLKMPAAGSRTWDTTHVLYRDHYYGEIFGSYWTSSVDVDFDYPLSIQTQISGAYTDMSMGGHGMSVRCMKDCTAPRQPVGIIGEDSVCAGATATWYVTAVDGALSYTWDIPAGWTGSSSSDTITLTVGTSGGVISVRANGTCDTGQAQTLNVSMASLAVAISVNGDTLSTALPYSTYQWYRNDTLLPGATNAMHVAVANGTYTVDVTDGSGCSGISAPYTITNVQVHDMTSTAPKVSVYPNPARDVVYITAGTPVQAIVRSMDGKLLLQKEATDRVELGGLPAGLYILQVRDVQGRLLHTERLTKLPE